MVLEHDELAGAILFFGDDGLITKEMYLSEFDAVLDAYVPAADLAGRSCKAVFVEIDNRLLVRSAVFFKVSFTKDGKVHPSWQLPLPQIAENASKGPDLGAGPIRLACASQCPIAFYRKLLWDPDLRKGKGQLGLIKKAVLNNRLELMFNDSELEDESPKASASASSREQEAIAQRLQSEYAKELRNHTAQLLKEQRLRQATIISQGDSEVKTLKQEYHERLDNMRLSLEEKDSQLQEEMKRNTQLKEIIDGQAEKIEGLREYFSHKLEQAQGDGEFHLKALQENYEVELHAKIEAATVELKEQLQMREVELLYRNEQEQHLQEEVIRLRAENKTATEHSGDHLLEKLVAKGVNFVTYQPGAGHITLPVNEISLFMESPVTYAAESCGVRVDLYNSWLEHYHAPVCRVLTDSGNICGENIARVDLPSDFFPGENDRCASHKTSGKLTKLKLAGS